MNSSILSHKFQPISVEDWKNLTPPSDYGNTTGWLEEWLLLGLANGHISVDDIQQALEECKND